MDVDNWFCASLNPVLDSQNQALNLKWSHELLHQVSYRPNQVNSSNQFLNYFNHNRDLLGPSLKLIKPCLELLQTSLKLR
jgi:hypothetical protein